MVAKTPPACIDSERVVSTAYSDSAACLAMGGILYYLLGPVLVVSVIGVWGLEVSRGSAGGLQARIQWGFGRNVRTGCPQGADHNEPWSHIPLLGRSPGLPGCTQRWARVRAFSSAQLGYKPWKLRLLRELQPFYPSDQRAPHARGLVVPVIV